MKMSEQQIRGNITTIEQALLLMILDELRELKKPTEELMPFEPDPRGIEGIDFEVVPDGFNEPPKPKQKRGKPAKKKK
jgi:hypothetical protein